MAKTSRIDSLVKYVLDVKPYHTKLLGSTAEVNFSDSLTLSFSDSQPTHVIKHQNVWTAEDILSLSEISDGTDASRRFIIPATVLPRFSVTDGLNYGQDPIGSDQALADLTDDNGDGVPNDGYPWSGTSTFSHQLGSDLIPVRLKLLELNIDVLSASLTSYSATVTGEIYLPDTELYGLNLTAVELRIGSDTYTVDASTGAFTASVAGSYTAPIAQDPGLPAFSSEMLATVHLYGVGIQVWAVSDTGRFAVPFHNGSHVRVNNALKEFGTTGDYIVDSSRSYIQFLSGKHPNPTDKLDINLLTCDRLYLASCSPYKPGDEYTITVNNTSQRFALSAINTELGVSKAAPTEIVINPSQPVGASWKLTGEAPFKVLVQQLTPTVGPIFEAFLNQPFDNGQLSFTLRAPWIEYYLSHGDNSYVSFDMLPFDDVEYAQPPDEADFWPNMLVRTKQGGFDPTPPIHAPVKLLTSSYASNNGFDDEEYEALPYDGNIVAVNNQPVGEIKLVRVGAGDQYLFELSEIPTRGLYVELRIEQATQLNPRAGFSMHEHLKIVQLADTGSNTVAVNVTDVYATHELTSGYTYSDAVSGRSDENGNERVTEDDVERILES